MRAFLARLSLGWLIPPSPRPSPTGGEGETTLGTEVNVHHTYAGRGGKFPPPGVGEG